MKKALLCANNYSGTQHELRGCVNDQALIYGIITDQYQFDDVRLLTNKECVKQGYLDGLQWLIRDSRAGDVLLFANSSHGSQLPCKDEEDGLDECICCEGFDFTSATAIVDDELRQLFGLVPQGVNLTIISDSCHSGTLLRDMSTPRHIINPNVEQGVKVRSPLLRSEDEETGCLIAMCADHQTSADAYIASEKRYQGAGTWCLSQALRMQHYDCTYKDLVKMTHALLRAEGYSQTPELDAPQRYREHKFLQGF